MTARTCDECPVKDLQRIKSLLEKRALAKMPEEVREPLFEAGGTGFYRTRAGRRENRQVRLP